MNPEASIGSGDRLSMTVLFAGIVHAVAIFGIGFVAEPPPMSALPSLDVILVQAATSEKPEKADFLANVAQAGGGTVEEAKRPTETFSAPLPKPDPGVAPAPIRASAPAPQPVETAPTPVLTQEESAIQVHNSKPREEQPRRDLPRDQQSIDRDVDPARLAAELDRQVQAYARRPKRKFISANSQEYVYAGYMAAWVERVQRVGNLNMEEVMRRRLEGNPVLTVAIRRDGSVEGIEIIRSSGNALLDDTARLSVQLSAPFAPLPQSTEEVDVLHITRTWQYAAGEMKMR